MKKTKAEVAAELKRVQEMAAKAGVSLAEAATEAGVTLTERKKECKECGHECRECDECNHENHHDGAECRQSGCECGSESECHNSECECGPNSESSKKDDDDDRDEEDEDDDPDDDKDEDDEESSDDDEDDKEAGKAPKGGATKGKRPAEDKKPKKVGKGDQGKRPGGSGTGKQNHKPKYPLFEGDCVACGRSEGASPNANLSETDRIKAMRKDFQAQVTSVVERAKDVKRKLRAQVAEYKSKAEQFDALFEDYVAETVTIAIETGFKKSADREEYHKSLKSQSYEAVKQIRDAFTFKKSQTSESTKKAALEETMSERAKKNFGETRVDTDDAGRRKTNNDRRARFAAK